MSISFRATDPNPTPNTIAQINENIYNTIDKSTNPFRYATVSEDIIKDETIRNLINEFTQAGAEIYSGSTNPFYIVHEINTMENDILKSNAAVEAYKNTASKS